MDQKRQGEIAVELIKYFLRKRGITFSQDDMREFVNVAKAICVTIEELKQFFRPLIQERIDELFSSR